MKTLRQFATATLVMLASGAAHAEDIPQMNQTWYPNQLLWLAISFGLLFAIVSLFIAPATAKILATREGAINDAIAEAERAKAEAEATKSDFESGGQSARAQAAELMAKAQAQSSAAAAEAMAKLDHDLTRKVQQAEARISDARKEALAGMHEATANLAASMAAKLLGRPVSLEEAKAATAPIAKLKKVG